MAAANPEKSIRELTDPSFWAVSIDFPLVQIGRRKPHKKDTIPSREALVSTLAAIAERGPEITQQLNHIQYPGYLHEGLTRVVVLRREMRDGLWPGTVRKFIRERAPLSEEAFIARVQELIDDPTQTGTAWMDRYHGADSTDMIQVRAEVGVAPGHNNSPWGNCFDAEAIQDERRRSRLEVTAARCGSVGVPELVEFTPVGPYRQGISVTERIVAAHTITPLPIPATT